MWHWHWHSHFMWKIDAFKLTIFHIIFIMISFYEMICQSFTLYFQLDAHCSSRSFWLKIKKVFLGSSRRSGFFFSLRKQRWLQNKNIFRHFQFWTINRSCKRCHGIFTCSSANEKKKCFQLNQICYSENISNVLRLSA